MENNTEMESNAGGSRRAPSRRKGGLGSALLMLFVVLAVVVAGAWWFLRPTGTTAQIDVTGSQPVADDGVQIVQRPSLRATATVNGQSADGPIDLTFGDAAELVVTVFNDGNLTMSDISVALDTTEDGTVMSGADGCELPTLAPNESADCVMEFTPTSSTSAVTANVFGFGPQGQAVTKAVNITLQ